MRGEVEEDHSLGGRISSLEIITANGPAYIVQWATINFNELFFYFFFFFFVSTNANDRGENCLTFLHKVPE